MKKERNKRFEKKMVEVVDAFASATVKVAETLGAAGANMLVGFLQTVLTVVFVLLFAILGYIVAKLVIKHVVSPLIEHSNAEAFLEKRGMHDALLGFSFKGVIGTLVKLVTVAVFLGVAANIANLNFLENLVVGFISYVPSLVQGAVILIIALLGAEYVAEKISSARDMPFAKAIATLVKIFVAYTAIVIALPLLLPGADVEILKLAFVLTVGAFALALGLGGAIAIGLGAKDSIAVLAKKKEKELEKLL